MAIFHRETHTPNPEGAKTEKHDTIDDGTFYVDLDGQAEAGWKPVGNHVDGTGNLIIELEKGDRTVHVPAGELDKVQSIMREQLTEIVEPGLAREMGKEALSVAFHIPGSPEAEPESHERTNIHVIDPDAGKTYTIDVSHKEK